MKLTMGELKAVIREALIESRDEYVVRAAARDSNESCR